MKTSLFILTILLSMLLVAQDKKKLHGIKKTYDKNGNVLTVKEYDHGKKIGVWIYYAPDNSKELEIYSNDSLREKIMIGHTGDTLNRMNYLYHFTSGNRLSTTLSYRNFKLYLKTTHSYLGQDSM